MEQTDNDIHSRGTVVEERTSTNRYYDEENDKWIEEEYSYKRTEIEGGAVEDDED